MTDETEAKRSWMERIRTMLIERLSLLIVLGVLAVLTTLVNFSWEVISDGRVVYELGGAKQTDYDALTMRLTQLEDQVRGERINGTVVQWLADPNRSTPERRLALFEDDVDIVAGRVNSAPQLCSGIPRTIRFCLGEAPCPDEPYVTNEMSNTFNKLVVDPPDWLVGAGWTDTGGGAYDGAGALLNERGRLSVELNENAPGFLKATYIMPNNALKANVQFKIMFIFVDQDFDEMGALCKYSIDNS